jgi:hypothetical protein
MILWIEFTDGSEKEIHVDDVYEGKQCLKYMIRYGADSGEYSVPYSQIKTYKITRL